jgi:hypothetical protein
MSLGQVLIAWVVVSVPVALISSRAMAMMRAEQLQPVPVRGDNVVTLRPAHERAAIEQARRMHPSCWDGTEVGDELPALRLHSSNR